MGRTKLKLTLTFKVLLIVVIILLFTISISSFISGYIFNKDYEEALVDRGYIICSTLKFQLTRLLLLGIPIKNIVGFEEQCLDAVTKYYLSYAMIVDDKNFILFHDNVNEQGKIYYYQIIKHNVLYNIVKIKNEYFYEIVLPVFIQNEKAASVKIGFPRSHVTKKTNKLIANSVFVAIFFFVISSALILLLISTWITIPIKRLTAAIKKIENKNNFNIKVDVKSNDEIGELGASFNAFISKLDDYQKKIKKNNTFLEKKVKERTFELEESKIALENDILIREKIELELDKYTKELERSNYDLEQFAYIASHDLKEPLRMISSYLQLLKMRYKNKLDSDADEFIGYAYDGAIRMQELISALLQYAQAKVKEANFQLVDLNDILLKVLHNLKIAIEENNAVISSDNLPNLKTDPVQMMQLLQNLISNAVKFKKENSVTIHVGCEKKEGEWLFYIKDNGIGFDIAHTEKIFQIFQKLHTKEEYKGTGIGLAVCKKIVERFGGRIWADSKPDKGAVFYFTVPLNGHKNI